MAARKKTPAKQDGKPAAKAAKPARGKASPQPSKAKQPPQAKPKPKPKKRGVPSTFNQDTADIICDSLIEGMSLRNICKQEDMPHITTVLRWARDNHDFRNQYALAREMQADIHADDVVDISDDTSEDEIEDENGNKRQNSEFVNRSRLRVDSRKWAAAKMNPKKYGDRMIVDHNHNFGDLSDDELKLAIVSLADQLGVILPENLHIIGDEAEGSQT